MKVDTQRKHPFTQPLNELLVPVRIDVALNYIVYSNPNFHKKFDLGFNLI